MLVELGAEVDVGLLDAVKELVGHAHCIDVDEVRLEEHLGRKIALLAQTDGAAVRNGVRLDKRGGLGRKLLLDPEVVADVAQLLLDLADRLKVGRAVERVPAQQQQLDEVARDVRAGNVEATHQVRHRVALAHRDDVRHTVTRVEHNTVQQTLRIQHQHGLHRHVDTAEAVLLKHDLDHLLAVLERVHRRLRQKHLALGRVDLEALVPRVLPHVLHVLPRAHHTVVQRVRDLQLRPRRRRLVAHHDVLQRNVANLLLRPQNRPAHHRREHRRGEVGTRKTGLHKPGSVVAHNRVLTSRLHLSVLSQQEEDDTKQSLTPKRNAVVLK